MSALKAIENHISSRDARERHQDSRLAALEDAIKEPDKAYIKKKT